MTRHIITTALVSTAILLILYATAKLFVTNPIAFVTLALGIIIGAGLMWLHKEMER